MSFPKFAASIVPTIVPVLLAILVISCGAPTATAPQEPVRPPTVPAAEPTPPLPITHTIQAAKPHSTPDISVQPTAEPTIDPALIRRFHSDPNWPGALPTPSPTFQAPTSEPSWPGALPTPFPVTVTANDFPANHATPTPDPIVPTSIAPTPATPPQPADQPLPIAPHHRGQPHYDRDQWKHWSDQDGDCINTRHEVLAQESLIPVQYSQDNPCYVASGIWLDPYTGLTITDPTELHVDHMVPLAEAHRSGASAWSAAQRQEYANDLTDPAHLIAVSASANTSKGARGPDQWLPPDSEHHCQYARDWTNIKLRWSLTATPAEAEALAGLARRCNP